MAIMNVTDEQYNKIQEIIIEVLKNRKLMFTKPLIIKIIENKLIEAGMEATRVNDIYFNLMFDGILNNMINNGVIYNEENSIYYEPLDYILYNKHLIPGSKVLYLNDDNGKKYNFINVTSGKKEYFPSEVDYILTGGIKNNRLIPPVISFEEIKQLYDDCIKEGSSKRDALEHILNYYCIRYLFCPNDDYVHVVCITKKNKNKGYTHTFSLNDKNKKKHTLSLKRNNKKNNS